MNYEFGIMNFCTQMTRIERIYTDFYFGDLCVFFVSLCLGKEGAKYA